jgi:acetyltransferase-like isoleucine patch superfamily enzyme
MVRDRVVPEQIAARFDDCRSGPRALTRLSKNCRLQFGKHVTIGAYTVITGWPEDIAGPRPAATLEVGDYTYFGKLNNIRVAGITRIEAKCQISQGVSIIGSNHSQIPGIPIIDQPSRTDKVGVAIEDDVWIGANSTILASVTIASASTVATGNVVTRDVPPNVVVAGVSARVLKDRK